MYKKILKYIKRILVILIGILILIYGILWTLSYNISNTRFGVSFSPEYAESLGLDWKETYQAILADLKPTMIRLSAPWNKLEPQQGTFDFSETDYLVNEAGKHNTKILFVVGQKIPRWPECYFPQWARELSKEKRQSEVLSYIQHAIERYKNNPSIEYWQIENEPFIKFDFGDCDAFDKTLVEREVALVRQLDPTRKIVMTDSGEMSIWYSASKTGDILGSTLYRLIISRYGFVWHYDYLPAGLYRIKARLFGNSFDNFFISELQGEPWFHNGSPLTTDISTQEQTMNPRQLEKNINYARRVGASRVYMWGSEWWYWQKTKKGDSTYWDIIKNTITPEKTSEITLNKN
ncbi:MAG: beta-galactosidase [Candidatus Paceibacterota bacterium]|jgi:hypothetical protein